ncbi:MAG: hypothetical protein WCF23_11505 [Candidatus Nitrosopolaris sp.]
MPNKLEQKYGEDALIEYWFAKILTYSSSERKEDVCCLIDPLIDFYQRNLIKLPSKEKYIRKCYSCYIHFKNHLI